MSPPDALRISETFVSIQGEGSLAGTPSWFVRLSGCNLRCAWCDTPYASWQPEGAGHAVRDLVDEARRAGVAHAVVTGGEPLIFPGCAELCRGLREAGLHVTIETAGTVWLDAPCDLLSLSPKLANSTPAIGDPRDPGGAWRERHESRRWQPDIAARLLAGAPARQVKFVVQGAADLPEIDAWLARVPGLAAREVFLMPEGVGVPAAALRDWTIATCLARGWRYGHRLHIELFGNRRGT